MNVLIRSIGAADRADWEPLWKGYQTFYKVNLPQSASDAAFARFLDSAEPMHALVAEGADGKLVGIVHYIFHRSTWTPGDYCYLQDLFTAESARGQGVGRTLIEGVVERAKSAGASRVYWLTHETNAEAMLLYDRVAEKPGFLQYRIILNR